MELSVSRFGHLDLAVHPNRYRLDRAGHSGHPDLPMREAVVLQREALQRGDSTDVIIGVHGPARPRIVGEGLPEHLGRPFEICVVCPSDLHVREVHVTIIADDIEWVGVC